MHQKPAQLPVLSVTLALFMLAGCSEPTAPNRTIEGPAFDVVADQTRVGDEGVHKGSHSGNLIITTLSATLTPSDLAQSLVGPGVTISNVTYQGSNISAGRFTAGTTTILLDAGVILSSGNAGSAHGPNVSDGVTTSLGTAGDADLAALTGRASLDATVLEFDFVPNANTVFVQYVFASDEYNEYVNSSFDDAFAFFVNGTNCALTPTGQRVSINTINNGNPHGSVATASNPALYRNNDPSDGGGTIDTEMDGLTTVLTCAALVNTGVVNHMKLAISDMSDRILDSNVFLKAGSFTTQDPADTTPPSCAITATGTNASGQKFIQITVEDNGSGLGSIVVTKAVNSDVVVPPFTPGTTDPVVITATKINQTMASQVAFTATDEAGNAAPCDPVDVTVGRDLGKPENDAFSGIPAAERWVTVTNGTPGLTNLAVIVNGTRFQVAGLANGATRTIDIASAMQPGDDNTIRLLPMGRPGGSAWVMIHD